MSYNKVNPEHYKSMSKETWEMMLDIWGIDAFIAHCEMTAFKYRMRVGKKPGEEIEADIEKARWYELKALEMRQKKAEEMASV